MRPEFAVFLVFRYPLKTKRRNRSIRMNLSSGCTKDVHRRGGGFQCCWHRPRASAQNQRSVPASGGRSRALPIGSLPTLADRNCSPRQPFVCPIGQVPKSTPCCWLMLGDNVPSASQKLAPSKSYLQDGEIPRLFASLDRVARTQPH